MISPSAVTMRTGSIFRKRVNRRISGDIVTEHPLSQLPRTSAPSRAVSMMVEMASVAVTATGGVNFRSSMESDGSHGKLNEADRADIEIFPSDSSNSLQESSDSLSDE